MKRLLWFGATAAAVTLGSVAIAGERGSTEEAQALLDRAVKLVQTEGEQKALAQFNDPKGPFVDRDLYVFCYGPDKKVTAHPTLMGKELATIKDPDGKEVGKEMLAIGEKGSGSLEYKWENPATAKIETKISFLKKAGSQVCGVGAYK